MVRAGTRGAEAGGRERDETQRRCEADDDYAVTTYSAKSRRLRAVF